MPIYYQVAGSGQNLVGQTIQDVTMCAGVPVAYNNAQSRRSEGFTNLVGSGTVGVTTITQSTSPSGLVVIGLPSAVAVAGNTICLTSPQGWPLESCYYVTSVTSIGASGAIQATTTTEYSSCYDLDFSGATATIYSSELDPQSNYNGYTSSENSCSVPTSSHSGPHASQQFVGRAYTDCWECFDGNIDPCNVTSSTITWWTDQSISSDRIITTNGSKNYSVANAVPGDNNPSGQNS